MEKKERKKKFSPLIPVLGHASFRLSLARCLLRTAVKSPGSALVSPRDVMFQLGVRASCPHWQEQNYWNEESGIRSYLKSIGNDRKQVACR